MQSVENKDLMNQFIEIMKAQGMDEQARELNGAFIYIVNLQAQMLAMTKELQEVKEQLNIMNTKQQDIVSKNDIKMISGIQRQVVDFSEQLGKIKNNTLNTIRNSVNTYKTKGKEQMKGVLRKGINSIKSKLQWCKNTLLNILNSCKEANRRLDAIGNELAQIGYSFGNIGKIAVGKELKTAEVSTGKEGVALTRMLKKPIDKAISFIEKQINKIDIMINKLDKFSEKINSKENERESVLEKLHSNQDEVKNNESKGEERVVKKEELQK